MVDYSVLIIDDDIWMQRILTKTLQSYGFKNVFMSSNGFEGIALAVEHRPTLIILDILMPELSGHLTLKLLKHIKYTKDIPVLMVSALSDIENLGLAVKSGTAGFISKPFTRATVYDKLTSIFGKDELELIMRGEPISGLRSSSDQNDWADSQSGETASSEKGETESFEKQSSHSAKKKVTQDQLLSHYQDDEKRSIESIKKLLLKSK